MRTYKLLEQDSVLLSQPLLIEQFGRAGAQFLSQLHYWLNKKETLGCKYQGESWIYNSAEAWGEQLHLSARQIRRLIAKFVDSGIVKVAKLNPHKSVRTNYYSIDYECLNGSIVTKYKAANGSFVHSDILSPSSCQNGTIYNDTKTTNKDFNKSEEMAEKLTERVGQGNRDQRSGIRSQDAKVCKQVEQVKNLKSNLEKKADLPKDLAEVEVQNAPVPNLSVPNVSPKPQTTTLMLKIWNETLPSKAQALMSKELAPLLVSAYTKSFSLNLEQWRLYCEQILSSSYLRGDQFQLSIFWALKFSTIARIRAGEFGVKKTNSSNQDLEAGNVPDQAKVEQMIAGLDETEAAKATRINILQAIGHAAYHSWFHQAKFIEHNGHIRLQAPNSFVENVWDRDYPWAIKG